MRPPRHRIRRNLKALDALKAAALIVCLLIVCIILLWLTAPMLQPREPEPDRTPQHDKPMWPVPTPAP
jgi:hypothetical protein